MKNKGIDNLSQSFSKSSFKNFVGAGLVAGALLGTINSCDNVHTSEEKDDSHSIEFIERVATPSIEERIVSLNEAIADAECQLTSLIRERDNLQWYLDMYNQLEKYKGKTIYAVVEETSPTDITHYFFSEGEKDAFVQDLQKRIDEFLKFSEENPDDECIGPSGMKVSSKTLNEQYFEDIVRDFALSPYYTFSGRDFWWEKAQELGIILE